MIHIKLWYWAQNSLLIGYCRKRHFLIFNKGRNSTDLCLSFHGIPRTNFPSFPIQRHGLECKYSDSMRGYGAISWGTRPARWTCLRQLPSVRHDKQSHPFNSSTWDSPRQTYSWWHHGHRSIDPTMLVNQEEPFPGTVLDSIIYETFGRQDGM